MGKGNVGERWEKEKVEGQKKKREGRKDKGDVEGSRREKENV